MDNHPYKYYILYKYPNINYPYYSRLGKLFSDMGYRWWCSRNTRSEAQSAMLSLHRKESYRDTSTINLNLMTDIHIRELVRSNDNKIVTIRLLL